MTTNNRRFLPNGQQGMLLCFPHNGKDWKIRSDSMGFVEFIKKVATFEQVF
jgi:agmatine deiminase